MQVKSTYRGVSHFDSVNYVKKMNNCVIFLDHNSLKFALNY